MSYWDRKAKQFVITVVGTLRKQGRGKIGRELSEKRGGGGKKKHFPSPGPRVFLIRLLIPYVRYIKILT